MDSYCKLRQLFCYKVRHSKHLVNTVYYKLRWLLKIATVQGLNPGGGDLAYERGGDARRKFWIKPLKETDLGVAQAFFDS